MSDISRPFISESRRQLLHEHLPRIQRCVERLSDDEVWWRPNAESNSIGNLLLHLSGNVRQWIVSGIGGAEDHRRRQEEFDERAALPAAPLLERLTDTVLEADMVLAALPPHRLTEAIRIQSFDTDVMRAIYHVVEHFSMHTGQIIVITKLLKGDVGFYDTSHGDPRPTWNERGVARGGRPITEHR
ncbi:MAG: DUF1572 domain-containing protein [Gemmatimonadetes bacterium]|nr:DUF1572 domain-containing protein [Gemmatimonadota bacterium]